MFGFLNNLEKKKIDVEANLDLLLKTMEAKVGRVRFIKAFDEGVQWVEKKKRKDAQMIEEFKAKIEPLTPVDYSKVSLLDDDTDDLDEKYRKLNLSKQSGMNTYSKNL
jgi:ribosomal protein L24